MSDVTKARPLEELKTKNDKEWTKRMESMRFLEETIETLKQRCERLEKERKDLRKRCDEFQTANDQRKLRRFGFIMTLLQ